MADSGRDNGHRRGRISPILWVTAALAAAHLLVGIMSSANQYPPWATDRYYDRHDDDRHRRGGEGKDEDSFDEMHRRLYDIMANDRRGDEGSSIARREYTLDAVPKSGGGLFDSDRELLGKLYRNALSVFEFGLGESTLIASHVGVPRYSGVDSDAVWVNKSREGAGSDRYHFTFADIGPTRAWGYPVNDTSSKLPYSYQTSPLYVELMPFDVYLVDGRYRVACVCSSMLHAMSRGADMSTVMFGMHDWGREYYVAVLEVGYIVHRSKLLVVLKKWPNVTEYDIRRIWEDHIWDSR